MALTRASLAKLRRRLPKGAVPRVVQEMKNDGHSYTDQYVYMVLKGDRYNQTVILALIKYAEGHERQTATLNSRAAGQPA